MSQVHQAVGLHRKSERVVCTLHLFVEVLGKANGISKLTCPPCKLLVIGRLLMVSLLRSWEVTGLWSINEAPGYLAVRFTCGAPGPRMRAHTSTAPLTASVVFGCTCMGTSADTHSRLPSRLFRCLCFAPSANRTTCVNAVVVIGVFGGWEACGCVCACDFWGLLLALGG